MRAPWINERLGRRFGLFGALWVSMGLVVAGAALWRQFSATDGPIEIEVRWLFPALACAGLSFGLRALRWHWLAGAAGARAPFHTSLRTQLVGFSLTLTPGKIGEVYKCYLMELATVVPAVRTAPIVLFEKLMEGLAFSSWSLLAAALMVGSSDAVPSAARSVGMLGLDLVIAVMVLRFMKLRQALELGLELLTRLPMGEKLAAWAKTALAGGGDVVKAPLLLKAMALTLTARLADGLALALVLWALGAHLSPLAALLAFNISGTVGGLSMLPGGIMVVEASLILSLMGLGAAPATAVAAALLSRILSFWLWVSIGLALLVHASLGPAFRWPAFRWTGRCLHPPSNEASVPLDRSVPAPSQQ